MASRRRYTSSAPQRGLAAHIRELKDDSGRNLVRGKKRQFLNKIIHDESMDYRPEYDNRLKQLAELNGVIDADATPRDSNTDPRSDLLEQKHLELTRQLEFVLTELKNHQSNFTKLQQALKEVRSELESQDSWITILMRAVAVLVLIVMWDFVILILQWICVIALCMFFSFAGLFAISTISQA